jgi:hypothetical protein
MSREIFGAFRVQRATALDTDVDGEIEGVKKIQMLTAVMMPKGAARDTLRQNFTYLNISLTSSPNV